MARTKSVVKPDLGFLASPPSPDSELLIRNVSDGGVCFSNGESSVCLSISGQDVVPATWAKARQMRDFIQRGFIVVEWVEPGYVPDKLPDANDAPNELRISNSQERAFAIGISTASDARAIEMANTMVYLPDTTRINLAYMRQNFKAVLELADWLEENTRNRPNVRKAIRAASRKISDL